MAHAPEPHDTADQHTQETAAPQAWEEPRLTFLEPTLTKHGRLTELTSGFFGGFTP
jgi:hypothetical protein